MPMMTAATPSAHTRLVLSLVLLYTPVPRMLEFTYTPFRLMLSLAPLGPIDRLGPVLLMLRVTHGSSLMVFLI